MDKQSVAWVTGASRGLGYAMASALAEAGWNVVLSARGASLHEAAATIRPAGGECLAQPCDVRRVRQVQRVARTIVARYGRCDLLVNNAGILGEEAALDECPPHLWQDMLQTNLTGPYLCTRAVLPLMLRAGRGLIVNITSGAALRTGFLNTPYGVSKAGLDRLTLGVAAEYGPRGIRCVSLSPPVSDTPAVRRLSPGRDPAAFAAPAELTARALMRLLENDPPWHNGQVLSVRECLNAVAG